tara:strand:- start:158 stop:523 length:366 start_codon:yes stop_codon:yes gene_type:complete
MKYLKQFIIGSSFPVVLIHYLSVRYYRLQKNYLYADYTFVAPPYLGFLNVLFFYLAERYNWSMEKRFQNLAIYGAIFIFCFSYTLKTYSYNNFEWLKYLITIMIQYYFIWNVIVYNIEKNI